MADEIEDGKFSFPLRFPFVDPTKVGPAEVPLKFPESSVSGKPLSCSVARSQTTLTRGIGRHLKRVFTV